MAEIEYQVDEMLFKMNALTGTSNLPEKPPVYFTDSDTTYAYGEDAISSGSEVNMMPHILLQSNKHFVSFDDSLSKTN